MPGIYVAIPTDSVFKEGQYRFTFSYPGGILTPPDVTTPKSYELAGRKLIITGWVKNATEKTLTISVEIVALTIQAKGEVNQAGVPIAFLFGALATIVGLALFYLTLVKVEKLIESPIGTIGLVAVAAVAVLILIRTLKK